MHLLRRRQAESADVIFGASYNQATSVRSVRLIAVCSVLIILTASASAFALSRTTGASATPTTLTAPLVLNADKSSQKQASNRGASRVNLSVRAANTARDTVVPTCSKGSYRLPSSIDPSGYGNGVHTKVDAAHSYAVYGTSTTAIWQQIYNCTPVVSGGRFAANTGYNLSSYYTYAANGDGTCSASRVSVTLHVNQIYPRWINTGASSSVASGWNSFIRYLRTHENGHVSIDKQYAQKLYDNIHAVRNVSCGSINAKIQAAIKSTVGALNNANDSYDARTNHGATQGAAL
jgi:predicted secreted Zn-dependent protease